MPEAGQDGKGSHFTRGWQMFGITGLVTMLRRNCEAHG